MRDHTLSRQEMTAMREFKEENLTFASKPLNHIQSLYRLGAGIQLEEEDQGEGLCWSTLAWGIGIMMAACCSSFLFCVLLIWFY